jgi:hypothetical protein
MTGFILKVLLFTAWTAVWYWIGWRQGKRGLPAITKPRL